KCMQMFTDPKRLRRKDPGHPDECNLFDFHLLVSPPEVCRRVENDCRLARIGCVDDKRLLAERINEFLTPIRDRREELLRRPDTLRDVIRDGSATARERARETMDEVRRAISLDYGLGEGS
ncbi:MAG: tryptophan--tRNA ligase, partial [Thermoanaerobaculia bacterium]|nr:tryptophan--tRNA ligase [Thermoanaerobaculia bacterium]